MKIAIYGGSFNPVHNEHVNIVKKTIDHLNLDKLIVCPSFLPPHKLNENRVDFSFRFNMLKLATEHIEKVEISNFEQVSNGVSYTYLTIEHFKNLYPTASLYFVVGTDMLLDFPTWYNPEEILKNCQLFVVPRKGDNLEEAIEYFKKHFTYPLNIAPFYGENVSSTKLRTYLKLGLESDLTNSKVLNYIKDNNLYVGNDLYKFVMKKLPKKRLIHTANVIVKGIELAKQIGIDKDIVETACLLHDVAKYEKVEDYKDFVIDEDVPKSVVHQFLGGYICKNILKIENEDIINAVTYHTTGRENMSSLEKIVFLADLIEEDRNYNGVEVIREKVEEDFEKGFSFAVSELEKYLSLNNEKVYWLTLACAKFYNKRG